MSFASLLVINHKMVKNVVSKLFVSVVVIRSVKFVLKRQQGSLLSLTSKEIIVMIADIVLGLILMKDWEIVLTTIYAKDARLEWEMLDAIQLFSLTSRKIVSISYVISVLRTKLILITTVRFKNEGFGTPIYKILLHCLVCIQCNKIHGSV